ncbi:YfbM family protein [Actinoplanes aureus]|uniref:YfbM family protein n=1 Tax=Actinoplanes aureus TaxID=2792083 RepID=A0A931G2B9_9ACTN|nr:YfbM family protein [Actinoplanes aureus]MBG0568873.1 YfbM family protein [Actinoplanes aureus]
MELIGHRLSVEQWRAMLDDPAVVETVIFGDLDDDDAEMPEPDLDLDKSWHGLHYLLTGTAWEVGPGAGAAILGGDEIGDDGGYGPARVLSPEAVRSIDAGLAAIDPATLRERFDPAAMTTAEIYPAIWSGGEEAFDSFLAPRFQELREFYRTAAAEDAAVLLAIT